jgi:hypothetical protein
MVPAAGLEPATSRLRSACTAIVLGRRIIILAETRAVGRSYGSRGALMLRGRRPARFNHSEPKIRSKSVSTRAAMSRVMSGFSIVVLP